MPALSTCGRATQINEHLFLDQEDVGFYKSIVKRFEMLSGLVGQKSFPDSLLTLCNGDLGCPLSVVSGRRGEAHVMFEALASQVDYLGRWFKI